MHCWCVQLQESKQTIDALEKERDFYFGKLRDIEVLCQEHENDGNPVLQQITDILYATEVSGDAASVTYVNPLTPTVAIRVQL